jgi:hypothetical protein
MTRSISDLVNDLRDGAEFPQASLQELLDRATESAPALLDILRDPAQVYEDILYYEEGAPYLAMLLLAKMRDQRLFPLLVRLLQYQDPQSDDPHADFNEAWDDFILDEGARIFASVFNGDLQALLDLARQDGLPIEVKATVVDCLGMLHFLGKIPRADFIAMLLDLQDHAFAKLEKGSLAHFCLAMAAVDFQIEELRPWLETEVLYWPVHDVTRKDVEDGFALSPTEAMEQYRNTPFNQLIEDPIAIARRWWTPRAEADDEDIPGEPYVRAEPKVGRNDSCPCGSGKKFKKCCGLL